MLKKSFLPDRRAKLTGGAGTYIYLPGRPAVDTGGPRQGSENRLCKRQHA